MDSESARSLAAVCARAPAAPLYIPAAARAAAAADAAGGGAAPLRERAIGTLFRVVTATGCSRSPSRTPPLCK